jgi:alcohol dehydrogenase YqhD (iron-dependent ADH family)
MQPFEIYTPTRIFFGPDHADKFAAAVAKLGKKAFIIIGGGSVERLGYLSIVQNALIKAGLATEVFKGIEPNPNAATIDKAAVIGGNFGADVVVPVGGGSAMDASKAIAGLIKTGEKEIWPFTLGQAKQFQLNEALPIAAVPTTAATASEVTPYAVISKYETNEKSVLAYEHFKPKAAWLNPAFTVEVNPTTTADGAADIISHVIENYLLGGNDSVMADFYCEGVMQTVMQTLPQAVAQPGNLNHRGNLLWTSTLALNNYQTAGRLPAEFVLHSMEHALSGFMPTLAHGRGLATLYPSYMRWLLQNNRAQDRLAQMAKRLFHLEGPEEELAPKAISHFESWLRENKLLQSLESLGFQSSQYEVIANYCVKIYGNNGQLNALGAMTVADIVAIFEGTARQV